jgi:hypothetical protein
MNQRRDLIVAVLFVASLASLHAQIPLRLVGQDWVGLRYRTEGLKQFESLVLAFGTEPANLNAEFRLTYDRSAQPQSGTIELMIAPGPANATTSTPLARKALTFEEFLALGTSDSIKIEELKLELDLVASQRQALVRRAEKWNTEPRVR